MGGRAARQDIDLGLEVSISLGSGDVGGDVLGTQDPERLGLDLDRCFGAIDRRRQVNAGDTGCDREPKDPQDQPPVANDRRPDHAEVDAGGCTYQLIVSIPNFGLLVVDPGERNRFAVI